MPSEQNVAATDGGNLRSERHYPPADRRVAGVARAPSPAEWGRPEPEARATGSRSVIVEMREYTLHPGKVPEYLQLYEREGLPIQREILGRLVGYYATDVGPSVNQVVHLWAYESFQDRDERRARLVAHPGWQSYVQKVRPLILEQQNRIMRPAAFFEAELRG